LPDQLLHRSIRSPSDLFTQAARGIVASRRLNHPLTTSPPSLLLAELRFSCRGRASSKQWMFRAGPAPAPTRARRRVSGWLPATAQPRADAARAKAAGWAEQRGPAAVRRRVRPGLPATAQPRADAARAKAMGWAGQRGSAAVRRRVRPGLPAMR